MCKPTVGFNRLSKSGFPGPPGDNECGIVRPVDTAMGNFLANVEAVLADRLKHLSPDVIAHQAQPPLYPQYGAHHHE